MIRPLVKRLFRLLGKSDHKIIAVYAASHRAYRDAVDYMRAEAPGFPVWLLAAAPVEPDVAGRCERVVELPNGAGLPFAVLRTLWPYWVAVNVVTFTREPGFAWMKLAPFFVFPWKLLVMNEHRDFFSGLPFGLVRHGARRLLDWVLTGLETIKDLLLGVFWKMAWTLLDPVLALTAQPWTKLSPEAPPLSDATAAEKHILLTEDAEDPRGDVGDLERLFERPDTFAAGFQPGRAGFQKDVAPRAAFRQLQPGEATAVLAPLAGTVLLDAEKLARLGGFPRARSRRCQWLLLYWKAARAGWKCYSVGAGPARVPMIPDRAFAEAEFCWRLLRERPRPQPGAGNFDTRRGSVCFHPRHQSRLRAGRRRVLIVSPYLPFPLSHGGAVRIFNLARRLSERCDLLLLTFRERYDQVEYERLASCFARVLVVDHDERRRPDPSLPEAVVQFRSRAMAAAIREAAEEYQPDLLQIEYTQLAGYREALPQAKAVLVEHDVTFFLHEQLCRSAPSARNKQECERWHRYESHWLRQYDAVALMSEEEKARAVGAGAPQQQTWVVPNGVDTERFHPIVQRVEGPPELLYVGSFRHLPNVLGFEHLRKEILPRLWQRFPELRLRVVAGPDYEKHGSSGGVDPRVQVEGFVENLAPYYARARVVVAPLTVSAGTNIKVMEALACGRPVVSTPIGCAGLGLAEGEEILVAAEADAFAGAVARLLEDPDLWQRLAERSRRAAVNRFSWQRAADRAWEMYEALWS
ncbi:MAG: glycosyltransferase family 4 protein [Acidobacteria bacterium]|nr:glycosyltransferase family 4 protein [Acidobacteriota bacterium]